MEYESENAPYRPPPAENIIEQLDDKGRIRKTWGKEHKYKIPKTLNFQLQ